MAWRLGQALRVVSGQKVAHDPAGGWRPGGGPVYRSRTPTMLARVNGVPNDQLGLAQQNAAQLLPEGGDSWAVEAEQDLGPGVELRRFEP